MLSRSFPPSRVDSVLSFLGVTRAVPDLALLDRLVSAYTQRVPWESASRIARRADIAQTEDCPRWPAMFWADAMQRGLGGTCFESNYAFFSLLRALGYQGYLTINDMGETRACHTAIILELGGAAWLVDVGMPLYTVLPVDPERATPRSGTLQNYVVRPLGSRRYSVERAPHPRPICYTLIDQPVPEADYRAALMADYGEQGLFLDAVIVNKVVDNQIWRFASRDSPYRLESFRDGVGTEHPIEGGVADAVASKFGMDVATTRAALNIVGINV